MRVLPFIAMLLFTNVAIGAGNSKSLCVFDPLGANGDTFNLLKDYVIDMSATGANLSLVPYPDESVAVADFVSGTCDILAATDIRIRQFMPFTGTISAVGALPTTDDLRTLLRALNRPKAERYLDNGKFAILGIFPLGAGYLFTDDREVDSVGEMAGRRVAALTHHMDALHMIAKVGATVVPSDITDFGGKFNNGFANTTYAPALAYSAYELYKGLGEKGGIVNYPLGQLTLQMVTRSDAFTRDFKRQSRRASDRLFDKAFRIVKHHEQSIDQKYWVEIPRARKDEYQEMFRQSRMDMSANGVYDETMLSIMRQVRCMANRAASECSTNVERE